jgi:hypothetical protein
MKLDDYMFSEEYSKDIRQFTKNNPVKTIFGGFTKDGYTRFILPDGTKVTQPCHINQKSKN